MDKNEEAVLSIIHKLKNEIGLRDTEIPKRRVNHLCKNIIWFEKYDDDEYDDGEEVLGHTFHKDVVDNRISWSKDRECPNNSIVSVDDMIDILKEAREKFGGNARLLFDSEFRNASDYCIGASDRYEQSVYAVIDEEESWENYRKRLDKFYYFAKRMHDKKKDEDELIRKYAPKVDISSLTDAQRTQILSACCNIINVINQHKQ